MNINKKLVNHNACEPIECHDAIIKGAESIKTKNPFLMLEFVFKHKIKMALAKKQALIKETNRYDLYGFNPDTRYKAEST